MQYKQWLLFPLVAVLLFFLYAQEYAIQHAISHLSEEINHTLKHDQSGQHSVCEECLCLDDVPDSLLPAHRLYLHAQDTPVATLSTASEISSKPPYRRYSARAPPFLVASTS
jgi:hypothetical protein